MIKILKNNIRISFNKRFCESYSKQGIFGLRTFINPKTIQDDTLNIIERNKYNFDQILKMDKDLRIIELYDKISNDCCTIIDGATVIYHTHDNPEMKKASYESIISISNLFEIFNSNRSFYNRLLDLYFSDIFIFGLLETSEMSQVLIRNIEELSVVHKEKQNIRDPNLMDNLERLTNDIIHPSEIEYKLTISNHEVNNLNSQVLKTLLKIELDKLNKNDNVIKTNYKLLQTIIKKSDNKELRDRAYSELAQRSHENLNKLINLLKIRLKYAQSLGYSNYAEFQLKQQTLKKKPQDLINELKNLWINLRPNLLYDLSKILENENTDIYVPHYCIDYYKSKIIDNSLKTINDKCLNKKYITVNNLLLGLQLLTKTLFNKDLIPILDEDLIKEEMIHPSILLCQLMENGKLIAKIYLDLFVRDGKAEDICTQYTIQGSKTLNLSNYKFNQIPIITLSTNFEVTDLDLINMPLTFIDAKTVFHEFGHVMHSALSKTDFQTISGIRVPLDFAEIPSHLFEYFIYDYEFCKNWMIDRKSNEVIDYKLHNLFSMEGIMFENIDFQNTLYHSILDLEMHSISDESLICEDKIFKLHMDLISNYYISSIFINDEKYYSDFYRILNKYKGKINTKYALDKFYDYLIPSNSDKFKDNNEYNKEINSLFSNCFLDDKFMNLKIEKEKIYLNNYYFSHTPHFRNYPSTYYTYIIGKIFSNLIWSDCFRRKEISKVGKLYEKEVLSKGFSESPLVLIENFFRKFKEI